MQIPFRFQPTPKQAKDQVLINKKDPTGMAGSFYLDLLQFLFG